MFSTKPCRSERRTAWLPQLGHACIRSSESSFLVGIDEILTRSIEGKIPKPRMALRFTISTEGAISEPSARN